MANESQAESRIGAMSEAIEAALLSHSNKGKAERCTCSLCAQLRAALAPSAGTMYADRLRAECAQIAEWKVNQLKQQLDQAKGEAAERLRATIAVAKEIGDRIRVLIERSDP